MGEANELAVMASAEAKRAIETMESRQVIAERLAFLDGVLAGNRP